MTLTLRSLEYRKALKLAPALAGVHDELGQAILLYSHDARALGALSRAASLVDFKAGASPTAVHLHTSPVGNSSNRPARFERSTPK